MKKKIKIAIYSRKSKYTDKGDSVGNQIEIAMKYIEEHYRSSEYITEIIIFEDDGFSGGNIDRPKFKAFLLEENAKPFDVLICYRLDRISRNIADFSNLMNHIAELGTSFVSIKEQFDTRTPMGRAMMYIASVFAQLEREVIAERIRDNMIELAKTGRWLGGPTPTGYTSERIEIVDVYEKKEDNIIEKRKKTASKLVHINEELEIIEKLFYKFLELKSLSKLESYCLQNEVLTKNNIDFSTSTLKNILSNPIYAPNDKDILEYFKDKDITIYSEGDRSKFDGNYGLMVYGKKNGKKENNIKNWIVSVGLHKPAIKKGIDWIRTQEILKKNKDKRYRANCNHDFLLSGILKCSDICELKEKSRGKRCNSKNIAGLSLDKLIIQKLKEILVPTSNICKELSNMEIKKDKTDIELKEEELSKKLKTNKESIKKIINKLKYMDIEIIDLVNDELKKLKEENVKIQHDILKLHRNKENKINHKIKENQSEYLVSHIINNYFKALESIDMKSKKDILRALIKEINGSGKNVEVKLLNTKISESDRRLFSNMIEKQP